MRATDETTIFRILVEGGEGDGPGAGPGGVGDGVGPGGSLSQTTLTHIGLGGKYSYGQDELYQKQMEQSYTMQRSAGLAIISL